MKSKHTPGPWKVLDNNPEVLPIVCKGFDTIAHIRDAGVWADYFEVEANAHLVAAAPDLLEACTLALEFVTHEGLSARLVAAIDKARGES